MADKYLTVDRVEELEKDGEIIGREVFNSGGNSVKVKMGKGGSLKKKWELLDCGIGKAFKFQMGEFKGYPFVEDFEEVKDAFERKAAERVGATDRVSPQEEGMWWKEVGEGLRSGYIENHTATITYRAIHIAYLAQMLSVLNIKEGKSETVKADSKTETSTEVSEDEGIPEVLDESRELTLGYVKALVEKKGLDLGRFVLQTGKLFNIKGETPRQIWEALDESQKRLAIGGLK